MVKYIILLIVCLKCAFATSKVNYLEQENFQIGISRIGVRLTNSTGTECERDLQIFLESLEANHLWALKLIDAFGIYPKSFHWGNYFWYSSKEFCEDLNDPYRITLSDRYNHTNSFNSTSPFPVRFWMIYFNFTSPIYVDFQFEYTHYIHIGLCLPQSCSQDEAMYYSQSYFADKSFDLQSRFDIQMNVVGAKSPEFKWTFFSKTGVLISFFYLALSAAFMIAADRVYRNHTQPTNEGNQSSPKTYSRLQQFLLCFHLKDNNQKLWRPENSGGFLPAISGFRAIICFWIVFSHVSYYCAFTVNNSILGLAKLEAFILTPVMEVWFFVDVFFIISSFLLVYNFLSNCEQMKTIKMNSLKENLVLYLRLVLGRYVRLMPLMLVAMVLTDSTYDLLDMYSPLRVDQTCKENWWYNLLFVNNFLGIKNMCSSWSWYLGCEMQFFILFAGLLFIFAKNKSLGKTLFVALLVVSVIITFLCYCYYDYTFQTDVFFRTMGEIYAKPWTRINSYTGGALIGWLFHKTKEHPIKVNVFWKSAFWTFATCLWLATSFMSYWRTTPRLLVAIIMSFGKLLFALCTGGMIIMCEWGHGGIFNRLMSSRPFLFLNKFYFSIYMVSPVITIAVFGLRSEAIQLTILNSFVYFLAISLCSIPLSFLVVLLVELPAEKFRSKFIARKRIEKQHSRSEKLNGHHFHYRNPTNIPSVGIKAKDN